MCVLLLLNNFNFNWRDLRMESSIDCQDLFSNTRVLDTISLLIVTNKNVDHILDSAKDMEMYTEVYELDPDDHQNIFAIPVIAKAVKYAMEHDFHLVIAVDPDNKKLIVAVRENPEGKFQILNVHQLSILLADLMLQQSDNLKDGVFLKTFRITEMFERMVMKNEGKCINIFPDETVEAKKQLLDYDERLILSVNDNQEFSLAGEDPIHQIITYLLKEEALLRESDKTLFDKLIGLYQQYGFYKEKMLSVDLQQKSQYKHYNELIDSVRRNTPLSLNNCDIRLLMDFKKGKSKNLFSGKETKLNTPAFNGIMIILADGSSIIMELTLHKMNYFVSVRSSLPTKEHFDGTNSNCDKQIIKLLQTVNTNYLR
jgi:phosphomannomutase